VTDLPDDQALQRSAQGDNDAFGVLYERYVARIYSYIYYRTGSENDAEDLTARVFHRAYNHIGSYKNTGVPFSAWLYRIAHNLVANWHRDNSRRKEVPLDETPDLVQHGVQPESQVIRGQQVDTLMRILRKLPAERQQLLILKFVDQLSNAEVGVIMGRSEGAIKSLYHRTLYSLKDDLDQLDI
jgi:RNA polymerase sigma-70 factor (ECF subfamily)